jgi:serine/threonine protein kinase
VRKTVYLHAIPSPRPTSSHTYSSPHSEVHKATHMVSKRVVALKRILMHNEKEGVPVTALREIKILKMLSHSSVVTVCDMVVEAGESVWGVLCA